jgi:hypothetical protein
MPICVHRRARVAAVIALSLLATQALAADNRAGRTPDKVIVQSGTAGVPVEGKTPPLQLSDDQRARIREVLLTRHTEIDLALKEHAKSKDFEAKIDEAVPKDLKGEAFPQPLLSEIPTIRQYTYLKFKGQVLIVNPMTDKIVDMFPETKS